MSTIDPPSIFDIPNYLMQEYADPRYSGQSRNTQAGCIETSIIVRPTRMQKIGTEFSVATVHRTDNPVEPSPFHWKESRFMIFDRKVQIDSFNHGEPAIDPVVALRFLCDKPASHRPGEKKKPYEKGKGHWISHIIEIDRRGLMTVISEPSLDWRFPFLQQISMNAHALAVKVKNRGHWEMEWRNEEFGKEE